jgi:hypothetical protein
MDSQVMHAVSTVVEVKAAAADMAESMSFV